MTLNTKFAASLIALAACFSTTAFASGSVSTNQPVQKEMKAEEIMAKDESAKELMAKQEMAKELMGKDLADLSEDELASLEKAMMEKKDNMAKEVMGKE